MPLLKFLGFPTGSTVSASATQGSDNAAVTVPAWGAPSTNVALSILTRRSDVPEARHAPEGIYFEALPLGFEFTDFGETFVYDPSFHEIAYEWDFGDAAAPWVVPRLPQEFNDPSRGFGKKVGHVFTTPGTYTVRCTARRIVGVDPVEVIEATATTSVTIADVDDVFDAVTTVVADFTGPTPDFTGAPPGVRVTDPSDLSPTATGIAETYGRVRIRLRGGDSRVKFGEADYRTVSVAPDSQTVGLIRLDTWGSGKVKLPRLPTAGSSVHNTSVVVIGYHIEGAYDPTSATFDETSPSFGREGSLEGAGSGYRVWHDIEVSNTSLAFFPRNTSVESVNEVRNYLFFANELHIHDTFDFGFLINDLPGDFFSFTGYAYVPAADQLQMPISRFDPGSSVSGIDQFHTCAIRTSQSGSYYLDGCDVFSRAGWTGGNPFPDGSLTPAPQPCLRFASDYVLKPGVIEALDAPGTSYVTRSVFEGATVMSMRSIRDQFGAAVGNNVFDGNICIGIEQTASFINVTVGALTVRNNLFIKPETDQFGLGWIVGLSIELGGTDLDPADRYAETRTPPEEIAKDPMQVYSNTVATLHDPAVVGKAAGTFVMALNAGTGLGLTYNTVVSAENAVYGPLLDPSQEALFTYAPDTAVLFEPRYKGRRMPTDVGTSGNAVYEAEDLRTEFATPPGSIAWYAPETAGTLPGLSVPAAASFFDVRRKTLTSDAVVGAHRVAGGSAPAPDPAASGGTESVIAQGGRYYRVHAFTGPAGAFAVDAAALDVEYLVVGGGGGPGGTGAGSITSGGGGAGGLLKFVAGEAGNTGSGPLALTVGSYPVTVGLGAPASSAFAAVGVNGGDSSFSGITALGGGGAGVGSAAGLSGGSGGGGGGGVLGSSGAAGGAGTSPQGSAGGAGGTSGDGGPAVGGGGGGAGATGADETSGGHGGDGVQTFIRNALGEWFAGGGGGGETSSAAGGDGGLGGGGSGKGSGAQATPGAPNTGGGGGGGGTGDQGAPGGDGVVILRYEITQAEYLAAGGQ